jgi:hypothetical protein
MHHEKDIYDNGCEPLSSICESMLISSYWQLIDASTIYDLLSGFV